MKYRVIFAVLGSLLAASFSAFTGYAMADECVTSVQGHHKKFKKANKNTSEDNSGTNDVAAECGFYAVKDVLNTRFGKIEAITAYEGAPSATIILLNGKKAFEGDRDYVGIEQYFQIGDKDILLLSSGATGSRTPDVDLSFLVIESANKFHIVSDKEFVSDFGFDGKRDVSMDKNGRIIVKLGYSAGQEMTAEFDSVNLNIVTKPVLNAALKEEDCRALFEMGSRECTDVESEGQGCTQLLKDDSNIYIFVTGVDMGNYRYISNLPGFSDSGFKNACFAWCEGRNTSYQQFKKAACSGQH